MQIAHPHPARPIARRIAFGALTALLLAASIAEIVRHGGGWWFAAFVIAPDLALLFGISSKLEKGQLHPRAVRLYNALHSYWCPGLPAAAALVLPTGLAIGALAWALHISLDRTVGYGMRTRDGFQRS
jgi:Domain of unknown function (DUF4260)